MSGRIAQAFEDAAKKAEQGLAKDFANGYHDILKETEQKTGQVADHVAENEARTVDDLGRAAEHDRPGAERPPSGDDSGPPSGGDEPGGLSTGGEHGQPADGNIGCQTAGDPVDVVSGQMITSRIDLGLSGLLPLELRRAYASGYVGGRLHGPGWSSTIDQRVEIDSRGIHFAGDDAQILHYPLPAGAPVLPVAGARWELSWDRTADSITITDHDRGWTRHFDGAGSANGATGRPLTALSDRNGNRITFLRDGNGIPFEVRHSCGYRVAVDTVVTGGGPRLEALRLLDAGGAGPGVEVVRYQYYPDGRLASVGDASGAPYAYEYDTADRITACIDRNGHAYEYVYDEAGRVVTGSGPGDHLSARFHYDTARRVTTVVDSLGHSTEYHYDERQRVTGTVDPRGDTTRTGYDDAGRVSYRVDELNRTTRFRHDAAGDLVQISAPDGGVLELAYNELHQIVALSRAGELQAGFGYDDRGNLLSSTDAAGACRRRTYDSLGRLTSLVDPSGHRQLIGTDPAGLVTAVTDPMGRVKEAEYDGFGRLVSVTDALGAVTRVVRRTDGCITERHHPDGNREAWSYDPSGNVVEERDRIGGVTRYTYGPFDRLLHRVLPDGEEQSFGYDGELRLTSVSGGGGVWSYRYDRAGHMVGETDYNGRELTYEVDGADQLTAVVDARGGRTGLAYDDLGRLTERVNPNGSVTRLDYDHRGCLVRMAAPTSVVEYTHDAVGRVLSETVDGRTTSYTYDVRGLRTSRTTPGGIRSTWSYRPDGLPESLTGPLGSCGFDYDAVGRELTRRLGADPVLTQSWDVSDQLVGQSLWARGSGTAAGTQPTRVQSRGYAYRADGFVTAVTDAQRGDRSFELNPVGRITRVSAETWSETYAYDRLGNIAAASDSRFPDSAAGGERDHTGSLLRRAGRTSYTYDGQRRLVRKRSYTLSGRRLEWRYAWDPEDRLVQVVTPEHGTWAYTYDPLGRRTCKWRLDEAGGESTEGVVFSWEGFRLAEQTEVRPDGGRRVLSWDWEPDSWRLLAQTERSQDAAHGVVERYYAVVTDVVDTPSELVSTEGRVLRMGDEDLWGRRFGGSGLCPLGRPGQYHDDETGLAYNYFRYYDPEVGRYLSTDPIGMDGGPNPHAYVPNPLHWIDPLGLSGAKRQPVGWGGTHYSLRPSNWTDGSDTNSYERNHIPARDAYLGVGSSVPGYGSGPAIRMDYDDHRNFISTGSGAESIAWRAKQRALIGQGKFDVAMKMDIGKIRKQFGTKYDAAITEMVDHLPNNKGLQKYLSDNGWKVRTCLLE